MRLWIAILLSSVPGFLFCVHNPLNLKGFILYDDAPSHLRNYYKADSSRIKKALSCIASQTNLRLQIKTHKTTNTQYKDVLSWIEKLKPLDVAFFYYAGRPLYHPKISSKWPALSFLHRNRIKLIPQKLITKKIKNKHPHLGLVFFDCYNKILSIQKKTLPLSGYVPTKESSENVSFEWLFTKTSGMVQACSLHRHQNAYGIFQSKPIGGVFTTALLGALKSAFGETPWSLLLQDLHEDCSDLSDAKQHCISQHCLVNPIHEHRFRKSRTSISSNQ